MLIELIKGIFEYPAYVTLVNNKYYLIIGNEKPEFLCNGNEDYKMRLSEMIY